MAPTQPAAGDSGTDAAAPKDADRGAHPKSAPAQGSADDQWPADPASQDEALKLLLGDAADRSDIARAAEIIGRAFERLSGERAPRVGTLNLFASGVSVGRDFNLGVRDSGPSVSSGSRTTRLNLAYVYEHTAGYVEPPGFEDAHHILENSHLLVLSAPGRTGRDAAALALLSRIMPAGEPKMCALPATILGNSVWQVPEQHMGYVVTDRVTTDSPWERSPRPETAAAERIDDEWLTRTSDVLQAANSFMVVVTGPIGGELIEATRRDEFVVQHLDMPDLLEVVRERVRVSGMDIDADEVGRRLADANAAEILEERRNPRFAVRAAAAVIEALKAGEDLAEALQRLRDPDEQVREWLGDEPGHREIAFALATAVLEESGYLTVSDAAIDLGRALSGRSDDATLRYRRGLLARHTWIELAPPERNSAAGSPLTELVRFRSPLLQPAVLTHAWYELDGMRPKILEWLRKLAGHSDIEVRARAAAAAGILAAIDFQHALHRYLLPWAISKSPAERQTAALALGMVGVLKPYTDRVWTLLKHWAAEAVLGTKHQLPATAALAIGGPLGVDAPERAVRVLRGLVADGDWNLLEPVAFSALQLIEAGKASQILRALLDWSEPQDDGPLVVKALTVFTVAVRQPAFDSGNDDEDDDGPSRAVLLTEAREHQRELVELWGRALGCLPVRPLALDALREWLRIVDGDWTAYNTVVDIVSGIAVRSDRDLERLEYHLERWAEDEDDPSTAAAHMSDALADAGETLP